MKITIEIGENELIHPQMAAAIAAQLESQVSDGLVSTEYTGVKALQPGSIVPFPEEEREVTTDPTFEKTEEEPYTLDEIRALSLELATIKKSAKAVTDLVFEVNGERTISESDSTHHQAIGEALSLAIKTSL